MSYSTPKDTGSPESDHSQQSNPTSGSPKRKVDSAGITIDSNSPVKRRRRASNACQCCRVRKVKCDVVEHGAPCTNCRLDEVACIVIESKRRKKHPNRKRKAPAAKQQRITTHKLIDNLSHSQFHNDLSAAYTSANGGVHPIDITKPNSRVGSSHSVSSDTQYDDNSSHHYVPHLLYAKLPSSLDLSHTNNLCTCSCGSMPPINMNNVIDPVATVDDLKAPRLEPSPPSMPSSPAPPQRTVSLQLPVYVKSLSPQMTMEDIGHLARKGALSIPETGFRNALLCSYIEFVHPYLPLIELHDFLNIIDKATGENGTISLLLYQAVLFTGVAFVDMSYLTAAGFPSRKAARKEFYLKVRTLYDSDYESDRVTIVQALLLMTYWYEGPNDQKDTWHWMSVAISLAQTIGLHCNSIHLKMDITKQKLWKRIWWSCIMRDRLVALGMCRPTRIKDEDHDIPMLVMEDFEIMPLDSTNTTISVSCTMMRDVSIQSELAILCIAKAKLCLCISHVLTSQYSVLVRDHGMAMGREGDTRSSVMLFPKRLDQSDEVEVCDTELTEWHQSLPAACLYRRPALDKMDTGACTVVVQRAVLLLCYYTTISALHRPQLLLSVQTSQKCRKLQDLSRRRVREASKEITRISQAIHMRNLTSYLPTTGVTVLLPAAIIHLLEIKSLSNTTREDALQGFCECIQVIQKLQDNYPAADFAIQLLEAAIRKAHIEVKTHIPRCAAHPTARRDHSQLQPKIIAQNVSQLIDAGKQARMARLPYQSGQLAFTIPAHDVLVVESVEKQGEVVNGSVAFQNGVTQDVTMSPDSDAYSSSPSIDRRTMASTIIKSGSSLQMHNDASSRSNPRLWAFSEKDGRRPNHHQHISESNHQDHDHEHSDCADSHNHETQPSTPVLDDQFDELINFIFNRGFTASDHHIYTAALNDVPSSSGHHNYTTARNEVLSSLNHHNHTTPWNDLLH